MWASILWVVIACAALARRASYSREQLRIIASVPLSDPEGLEVDFG